LLLGLFGRHLLPDRRDPAAGLEAGEVEFLSEITITEEGAFTGQPIGEIAAFRLPGLRLIALRRGGELQRSDLDGIELKKGDRLIVAATTSELLTLAEDRSLRIGMARQPSADASETIIMEAVVAPQQ